MGLDVEGGDKTSWQKVVLDIPDEAVGSVLKFEGLVQNVVDDNATSFLYLDAIEVSQGSCPSSVPSSLPSSAPSAGPSSIPSLTPSGVPSSSPSFDPSGAPSSIPSEVPSGLPSFWPSLTPSGVPSSSPSLTPSGVPSSSPSSECTPLKKPVDSDSCLQASPGWYPTDKCSNVDLGWCVSKDKDIRRCCPVTCD